MNETTTTTKKIKISMSERRPVEIVAEEWPVIAKAVDHDGKVECQANNVWAIKVREHKDGRRLVYGWHEAGGGGQYAEFRPTYGGFLLDSSQGEEETVRSIRRVAGMIKREDMGSQCVAALPAEEI